MKNFFTKKKTENATAINPHPSVEQTIEAPKPVENSIGVRMTQYHRKGSTPLGDFTRPDYSHLPDATNPIIVEYFEHVDTMLSSRYENLGYGSTSRPHYFDPKATVQDNDVARAHGADHIALCARDHPCRGDYLSFFKEMFKRDIFNLFLEDGQWHISMYEPIPFDDDGNATITCPHILEALSGYDAASLSDASTIDGNAWIENIAPSEKIEALNEELFTYLTETTVRMVNAAMNKKEMIAIIDIDAWISKDLSYDLNVAKHDQYAFGEKPYSMFINGYQKYQSWLNDRNLYHVYDAEDGSIRVSPVVI